MELPEIAGTLLYVEDNPENLELMELIVSRIEGLSMISSHNAEQGIELARAEKPDLIILDINLPGMSGLDALKKLRRYKNTKNIPVLALSAAATKKDIEKGMEAGFKKYITKPFQVDEIVGVLLQTMGTPNG
jgi:CheY-like chemotaxis protein